MLSASVCANVVIAFLCLCFTSWWGIQKERNRRLFDWPECFALRFEELVLVALFSGMVLVVLYPHLLSMFHLNAYFAWSFKKNCRRVSPTVILLSKQKV
jgi:hypothetical protein